jgi:hypothetical protein
MRVYEAGHHDVTGGIDFNGVARLRQILHSPAWSNFQQNAIPNQDRSVGYRINNA